jgi:hypothetical protein
MVAERPRPSLLKQLLRRQRRLLVRKRNYRIVHLRQGVTRMNVYLLRQLFHLQQLSLGYLLH